MQTLVATGVLLGAVVASLGGCAWRSRPQAPPNAPHVPAEVEATPPVAPPEVRAGPTLEAEQRRLADLFRGTPVGFVMQGDGSLRVTVPLRFAFDKGRSAVKPPLGAVLDRVARSQRDEPTQLKVAAPGDPTSKSPLLANARAASIRDYMVWRGVEARRFTLLPAAVGPSAAASAPVTLVITDRAAAYAHGEGRLSP